MTPSGPIGEAGATARTLVDKLGQNPFILASVVVNIGLMGLLYWQAVIAEHERKLSLELLYKNRTEVGQLLLKCRDGSLPEPK